MLHNRIPLTLTVLLLCSASIPATAMQTLNFSPNSETVSTASGLADDALLEGDIDSEMVIDMLHDELERVDQNRFDLRVNSTVYGGLKIEGVNGEKIIIEAGQGGDALSLDIENADGLATSEILDINDVVGSQDLVFRGPGNVTEDYIGTNRMKQLLINIPGVVSRILDKIQAKLPLIGDIVVEAIRAVIKSAIEGRNKQINQWIANPRIRGIRVTTHVSGGGPYPDRGVSLSPLRCRHNSRCRPK